jgi:hypothetical protein
MMTSSRDGVIIGCAYLNGMNLFKNRALMGGSTPRFRAKSQRGCKRKSLKNGRFVVLQEGCFLLLCIKKTQRKAKEKNIKRSDVLGTTAEGIFFESLKCLEILITETKVKVWQQNYLKQG